VTDHSNNQRGKKMNRKIIEDFFKSADFTETNPSGVDKGMNYFAEDATLEFAGNPDVPPLKGKHAIRETLGEIASQFVEMEHIIHRFVLEGDLIALEGTARFKRPDGEELTRPFADFIKVKGGLIINLRAYIDLSTLPQP
jgi:ketosteroid isomerase-like protein